MVNLRDLSLNSFVVQVQDQIRVTLVRLTKNVSQCKQQSYKYPRICENSFRNVLFYLGFILPGLIIAFITSSFGGRTRILTNNLNGLRHCQK